MRNGIKITAAVVVGYLVGFYELKYRLMKMALENKHKEK